MEENMRTTLISVILLAVVISCSNTSSPAFSYNYTIEQQHNCFCPTERKLFFENEEEESFISPGPGDWVRLYVENDIIVKAIRVTDNYELTTEERAFYKSLNDLEAVVAEVDTTVYTLAVTIDPADNYLSSILVNPKPITDEFETVISVIMDASYSYYNRNYTE